MHIVVVSRVHAETDRREAVETYPSGLRVDQWFPKRRLRTPPPEVRSLMLGGPRGRRYKET